MSRKKGKPASEEKKKKLKANLKKFIRRATDPRGTIAHDKDPEGKTIKFQKLKKGTNAFNFRYPSPFRKNSSVK